MRPTLVKPMIISAISACLLAAGCASYTQRTVVEKPVPAQSTVYTAPAGTSTTSVSVN